MIKKIIFCSALISTLLVISCGGGGGEGSSSSGGTTVLSSSLQGVSASTMTVGSAATTSGSTQVVWLDKLFEFFKTRGNPFISSAYAQSLSSCSDAKQLIASQDSRTWSVMGLTTASTSASCVKSYQDAGNYFVLATIGVTDASGNTCDLVAVTKSSGATTCLTMPLANRASSGNPSFLLGSSAAQPAQLTVNGNYFLVGFYTNNSNAAYIGFESIDFTGNTPTGKVAYAEYGTQVSGCAGTPSVNGHNIFWSSFWLQENGNFIFNQFNQTQCTSTPHTGVSNYYYVDANNTTDPLSAVKYLFDQHTVTANGAYEIDNTTSPLGDWLIKTLVPSSQSYVTWQNTAGTTWEFGAEVLPGGSTSATDLSFYIVVGNANGSLPNSCSTTGTSVYGANSGINGNELIKVVISNGVVTFQDYGATNIGTGYGANPLTDNVYLTANGQKLVSVHWTDDGGNLKLMKITRQLTNSACDVYTKISPTTNVPIPASLVGKISTVGNGNFIASELPFTYRAKDYIYMYGFNSNPGDPNCVLNSGCTIPPDAQIWAFNKSTDAISIVSLTQLTGSTTFFETSATSNPLSNKISNTMIDGAGNKYWYSMGTTGVEKMIKFSNSVDVTNGFISGTN